MPVEKVLKREITVRGRTKNNIEFVGAFDMETKNLTVIVGIKSLTLPIMDWKDIIDSVEATVYKFCEEYQPPRLDGDGNENV